MPKLNILTAKEAEEVKKIAESKGISLKTRPFNPKKNNQKTADPSVQAKRLAQEKETLRNSQKHNTGGTIKDYGGVLGDEGDGSKEANAPLGSTADEEENKTGSEKTSSDMDENEPANQDDEEPGEEGYNENLSDNEAEGDESSSDNSLNRQLEQARNEIARNPGENKGATNDQNSKNSNPGVPGNTNPKNEIERARNLAKATASQVESVAEGTVKKAAWSIAKKWLVRTLLASGLGSIIFWIVVIVCLIIIALIAYQLAKHPLWTAADLLTGRYGDLVNIIFDL